MKIELFYGFPFYPEFVFIGPNKVRKMIFYYSSQEGGGVKGRLTNVKLFFESFPYTDFLIFYFFLLQMSIKEFDKHLSEVRNSYAYFSPNKKTIWTFRD